jgi:asparagine synthase (glutamine-hydrolysing)
MCGIFGFWKNTALTVEDIDKANKCLSLLKHRGPDNQNYWVDKNNGIFFGHTRLSIIGLDSINNQPAINQSSVIIYNGELYNFLEIKNSLINLGYKFKTSSDTEVVQLAWNEWGEKCLDKFDGMYSFAIFQKNKLFIVNDLFGEKPIYYSKTKNGFYFSSEIQVLQKFLNLNLNMTELDDIEFLSLGFLRSPRTGFNNLNYLEPASIIEVNKNSLKKRKYWNLSRVSKNDLKNKFETKDKDKLLDLLISSTEKRLFADVNIGLFLSSGMDSTLIAAIISKELNRKINTYTVSFPSGVDESSNASEISNYLGLENTTINSDKDENMIDAVNSLYSFYNEPNDNLTALSINQISRASKSKITVALGGIGGDELFYGYNKYHFLFKNRFLYKLNKKYYSLFLSLLSKLKISNKLNNLNDYINCDENLRLIALKDLSFKKIISKYNLPYPNFNINVNDDNFFENIRSFDLNHTLPNSYLKSVDRGSMKASLEVRTPYLNRHLFEYMNQFSSEAFFQNGNKFIQKSLLKKYLPEKLIATKKKGFVAPYQNSSYYNFDNICLPKYLHQMLKYLQNNIQHTQYQKLFLRLSILNSFYKNYG